MSETGTDAGCNYSYDPKTEIHEFVYTEASRRAVDAWLGHLDRFCKEIPADQPVRLLMDLRDSGHQPLSYTFERLRRLNDAYDVRPKARFCFLYAGTGLMTVVSTFAQIMRTRDTVRFFYHGNREAAVKWLTSDER